jgi:6-phosphogluconolactonase
MHPGVAPHARVNCSMSALNSNGPSISVDCRTAQLVVLNATAAPQKNAISTLANDNGVRLDVYWCEK